MAKYALLVGMSEYESRKIKALPGVVKDIEAMQRILRQPEIGGFDDVKLLKNVDTATIQLEIQRLFIEKCKRNDLALLYFSGHGWRDENRYLYFLCKNSIVNSQNQIFNGVSGRFVQEECMNRSKTKRQVLILDCCFSGAFAEGMSAKDLRNEVVDIEGQLGGEGRAVLTSSTATQVSFEDEIGGGIYTRYLVEGIEKGGADADDEGAITVGELHKYAKRKVQEAKPAMKPEIFAVREGYTIKLAQAPVSDSKLIYRQEVEHCVKNGGFLLKENRFKRLARRHLNLKQRQCKLTSEEVKILEEEVLKAIREFQLSLKEYEEALVEALEDEGVLSDGSREILKRFQESLKLRDQDVAGIHEKVGIGANISNSALVEEERLGVEVFKYEVVSVNKSGEVLKQEEGKAEYFREDLGNGISLDMVYIPGGKFMMGSPSGEGSNNEKPQHELKVLSFYMGKFQVTQVQWKAVAGLPKVKLDLEAEPSNLKGDNHPVEKVSWNDAVEFCARLSKHTGREYRLPSEAEWEYACRAGTTTSFHFGETITTDLVNYGGKFNSTTSVGKFPPNAFGLYDMHGNVWEWCLDDWHGNYEKAPTDGSAWIESENDNRYQGKVLRGGSWLNNPESCRSACRYGNGNPELRYYYFGFRVVCAVAQRILQ